MEEVVREPQKAPASKPASAPAVAPSSGAPLAKAAPPSTPEIRCVRSCHPHFIPM